MSKPIIFKGRKSTEFALSHLIEVVLGISAVIFLIYFSLKLGGVFFGRQEYDSAMNNLNQLELKINELTGNIDTIKTTTTSYSIPDNYILVGFSYQDKGTMKTLCTDENIVTSRPKICQGKSCICIYPNSGGITDWSGKDFDSKEGNSFPIKCKTFDKKMVFLAAYSNSNPNFKGAQTLWKPSNYPNSGDYAYLVVYGICGGPWRTNFGVKQIYLEKYSETEINYIFIGDMSDGKIKERSMFFANRNS